MLRGLPRGASARLLAALAFLSAGALAQTGASQADSSSLLAAADAVLGEMSEITGLPVRAPLKKQMIGRPEIQKYLIENLHSEYSPEQLHAQQATLQAFGLVSSDFDLEKFLITFYTEQAAGFYDPRRKTMFLADWVGEDMQNLVLAHELTHALQDQNFDLEKFLHALRDNDDATNARQAVVEGYATAAMMQHLVRPLDLANLPSLGTMMDQVVHLQMGEFPAFSNAPFFFRLQALFPYAQGMAFMQQNLAQGGWKKLGALFRDPPLTTKEIFEPRFYLEHRPLSNISMPRPALLSNLRGLRVLAENVMGELGYYALLGQFISEEEAKSVSTGWVADRYIVYERTTDESPPPQHSGDAKSPRQDAAEHHYVLLARTRWSSPEAALAFWRDYRAILAKKCPDLTADPRSTTDLFVGSSASGGVVLLRKGDECLWAEGLPASAESGARRASQNDPMLDWLRSLL